MSDRRQLCLAVLMIAFAPSIAFAEPNLVDLRRALEAKPEDVDLRLKLALALSWNGEREQARKHTKKVLEKAPTYWDAHLLLARLDAWEEKFDEARERLERVLQEEPGNREATIQLAETELWAGQTARSKDLLLELIAAEPSADLHYRLARVEAEALASWSARVALANVLAIEPTHAKAVALKRTVPLVVASFLMELEVIPGDPTYRTDTQLGHGELLSVSVLPRSRWSLTFTEEFRRRYETNNNRIGLQFDWRPEKEYTVTLLGAFGAPAEVVPTLTGGLRFAAQIWGPLDAAASYRFDRYPDLTVGVGTTSAVATADRLLHRLRLEVGYRVIEQLYFTAAYTGGYFTSGLSAEDAESVGVDQLIHSAQFRLQFEGLMRASVTYGLGREVETLMDRSTTDQLRLLSLMVHDLNVLVSYEVFEGFRVLAFFGTQFRSSETYDSETIRGGLGVRYQY